MYKRLIEYSSRNIDKVLHFAVGGVLSLFAILSVYFWCIVPIAAICKEMSDKRQPNNRFDEKDVFATVLGGVPILAVLFINYLLKGVIM